MTKLRQGLLFLMMGLAGCVADVDESEVGDASESLAYDPVAYGTSEAETFAAHDDPRYRRIGRYARGLADFGDATGFLINDTELITTYHTNFGDESRFTDGRRQVVFGDRNDCAYGVNRNLVWRDDCPLRQQTFLVDRLQRLGFSWRAINDLNASNWEAVTRFYCVPHARQGGRDIRRWDCLTNRFRDLGHGIDREITPGLIWGYFKVNSGGGSEGRGRGHRIAVVHDRRPVRNTGRGYEYLTGIDIASISEGSTICTGDHSHCFGHGAARTTNGASGSPILDLDDAEAFGVHQSGDGYYGGVSGRWGPQGSYLGPTTEYWGSNNIQGWASTTPDSFTNPRTLLLGNDGSRSSTFVDLNCTGGLGVARGIVFNQGQYSLDNMGVVCGHVEDTRSSMRLDQLAVRGFRPDANFGNVETAVTKLNVYLRQFEGRYEQPADYLICPEGHAMTGITMTRSETRIAYPYSIQCRRFVDGLATGGNTYVINPDRNTTGSWGFSSRECPSNSSRGFVTGIRVQTIESFDLTDPQAFQGAQLRCAY